MCVVLRVQVCSVCTLALPASVLSQVTDGVSGSDSLKHGSRIAGLFVICVAVLTLILETFIVVLRFLNIGAINLQMKKFFIAVSFQLKALGHDVKQRNYVRYHCYILV